MSRFGRGRRNSNGGNSIFSDDSGSDSSSEHGFDTDDEEYFDSVLRSTSRDMQEGGEGTGDAAAPSGSNPKSSGGKHALQSAGPNYTSDTSASDDYEHAHVLSLRTAMYLFIMLFIGIAAVTAASYYAFREAHLVTDDSRFQATVNHFSTHASLGLEEPRVVLMTVANAIRRGALSLSNTTQTSAFLARQMSEFPQLLRMWTSTTAGAVIAATNSTAYLSEQRSGDPCLIGYVPAGDGNRGAQSSVQCPFTASEQPWYTVAMGHPSGPAWTALRHDAGLGHTIMSLAILVNDTAGSGMAIVAVDIDPRRAGRDLSGDMAFAAKNGALILVLEASTGAVLASSAPDDADAVTANFASSKLAPPSNEAFSSGTRQVATELLAKYGTYASIPDGGTMRAGSSDTAFSGSTIASRALSSFLKADGLHWRVVFVGPPRDVFAMRTKQLAESLGLWLAVVIYVLSAWTLARLSSVALEREASAKSPHSTRHNGTKKRCGCFTRATSKMRADVIGGMRLLSVAMLSRVAIVLLCTVAIVCSMIVWNLSADDFEDSVHDWVNRYGGELQHTANAFVRGPTVATALLTTAASFGQLPVKDSEFNDTALVRRADQLLTDMLVTFNQTRTPLYAAFVGYSNDNIILAKIGVDNALHIRFRDETTSGRRITRRTGTDGARDMSQQSEKDQLYVTTGRPWFQMATTTEVQFSNIYSFSTSTGDVWGVTAVKRWIDPVTKRELVLAADLNLSYLQTMIDAVGKATSNSILFVAERPKVANNETSFSLLATSAGSTSKLNAQNKVVRRDSIESDNNIIQRAARRTLPKVATAAADAVDTVALQDTIGVGSQRVWVSVLDVTVGSLRWLLVALIAQDDLIRRIRSLHSTAFLAGAAAVVVTWFVAMVNVDSGMRQRKQAAKSKRGGGGGGGGGGGFKLDATSRMDIPVRRVDDVKQVLGAPATELSAAAVGGWSDVVLAEVLGVVDALRDSEEDGHDISRDQYLWLACARLSNVGITRKLPTRLAFESLTPTLQREVVHRLILRSKDNGNVLRQLHVMSVLGITSCKKRLYNIYMMPWVHNLRVMVVLAYMLLVLWDTTNRVALRAAEAAALGLLSADLTAWICVMVVLSRQNSRGPRAKRHMHESLHGTTVNASGWHRRSSLIQVLVLGTMWADWIIQAITGYTTGPEGADLLLPYSVLLRPFLLVFASSRLRTAMVTLAYALAKSRVVFGVGGSLLLVAAVISTTFLGEDLAAADGGDLYGALQSTAVSMFVYVFVGENYSEVVDTTLVRSWVAAIGYILLGFIGSFFVVSMLVAFFSVRYSERHERLQNHAAMKRRVRRRAGLVLAFRLMRILGGANVNSVTPQASSTSPHHRGHTASGSALTVLVGTGASRRTSLTRQAAHSASTDARELLDRRLFAEAMVSWGVPQLTPEELHARAKDGWEMFTDDLQHVKARLDEVAEQGCGPHLAHEFAEFGERCRLVHFTFGTATDYNVVDIVEFIDTVELYSLARAATTMGATPERTHSAKVLPYPEGGAGAGAGAGAGLPPISDTAASEVDQKAAVDASANQAAAAGMKASHTTLGSRKTKPGLATLSGSNANMARLAALHMTGSTRAMPRAHHAHDPSMASGRGDGQQRTRRNRAHHDPSTWDHVLDSLRFFFDGHTSVPFDMCITMVILIHAMLLAMASATGTQVLTPYLALFLVLYCVEIVLRVAAGADGWRDIWELKRLSRKRDVAGQPLYAAMGLRTDAGVTLVSVALYIGSRIQMGTPIVDWDDPWRGVLAVPIVRLMYSATATRVLLFGLISTMHDVVGVFAQLLVLHYVFGIVGMWVLAGKVSALEGSELPLHFDNMLDAQRSLTAQLLDSSNWADLLNMAIEATGGLGISFYFIFYASLMQILFTSILISLVVEGYQDLQNAATKNAIRRKNMQRRARHDFVIHKLQHRIAKASKVAKVLGSVRKNGTTGGGRASHVTSEPLPPTSVGHRSSHSSAHSLPGVPD